MISATFFGEITTLDSRAVWYSDEEDDDDEECVEDLGARSSSSKINSIIPITHDTFRSSIVSTFERIVPAFQLQFTTCVISSNSFAQIKNFKPKHTKSTIELGNFGRLGRAFAYEIDTSGLKGSNEQREKEYLLWLMFDAANPTIVGHEVGYFVEYLRELLNKEFNLNHLSKVIILSRQFSNNEHLEYLSNFINIKATAVPFVGQPILPPSLVKSQFESALFEQLTLTLKMALVVCLPNPRDFWFDKTKNWPSVPDQIIEQRLHNDDLEKTLIFT